MNIRRRLPLLIVLVALVLRVSLALQGGQYFFGDEARHTRGLELWLAVREGRWTEARAVLAQPEHAGFTILVAGLAPVQQALAGLAGNGDWRDPAQLYASAALGAALLAALSVIGLWLVHRLALAGGAGENEALLAMGLMAASNLLFYHARHLLPYDAALTAWLGSLLLVHRGSPRALVGSGLLTGAAYHLYNGYWFLVPAAAAWLWLQTAREPRLRLGAWWSVGTAAGLGLPAGLGWLAGGAAYGQRMHAFSDTVQQGLFSEGWSLPWACLWHGEQALGLLVLAALIGALVSVRPPARVVGALAVAAFIYGLMCLFSVGLERFVVYARTVRPLVPLFCLAGGWALGWWIQRLPRLRFAPALVVAGLGLFAIAPHFGRVFPREFEMRLIAEFGQPKRALSFSGSVYRPLQFPVTRPELALVDVQFLHPVRDFIGPPEGIELLSLPHPLAYAPYQYEGHTPRERRLLREHEPRLRLVRLTRPDQVPDHPPPEIRFTDADRPDGRDRSRP